MYKIKKQLESLEDRIRNASYSEEDKSILIEYEDYLFAKGVGIYRVVKLLGLLNLIASKWSVTFGTAKKKDIVSLISRIERNGYAVTTRNDYKKCIKSFYKWYYDEEKPAIIDWIKIKPVRTSSVQREDLLTHDEIIAMIDAAADVRNQAIISVLADSGARIGEIAHLCIKNVCFDDYSATISVDGKTDKRDIRLLYSVPALSKWMDIHPQKHNMNAPLWVNTGTRNHGQKMDYGALYMMIKRTATKAGIVKNVHPHLFRHSRSTDLANHLSESQLKAHLGWAPGSDMPKTYVHLSSKDVGDFLLSLGGYKEKKAEPFLLDKVCHRCNTRNSPAANLCSHCGCPLDLKATMDHEQINKELSIEITSFIAMCPYSNSKLQENLCVG
ncbi:integrase family protein [Methanolobus psychrophilus R15]|nr:integrase family protein [Methanolobus psychrophilus R15]